jgi:hypothetical protein
MHLRNVAVSLMGGKEKRNAVALSANTEWSMTQMTLVIQPRLHRPTMTMKNPRPPTQIVHHVVRALALAKVVDARWNDGQGS